jgi:hypothetical protein
VLGILLGIGGGLQSQRGSATSDGLTAVQQIPLTSPWGFGDASLFIDAPDRRLLALQISTPVKHLRVFDLDSLRFISEVPVKGLSTYLHAVDPDKHHVFLGAGGEVDIYDINHLDAPPQVIVTPSSNVTGLYYSSHDHLLYGTGAATPRGILAFAIDPNAAGGGAVLWSVQIPKCIGNLSSRLQQAIGESSDGKYLYTVCVYDTAYSEVPGNRGASAIARMRLNDLPASAPGTTNQPPDTHLFPGITPGAGGESDSLWIDSDQRMVTVVTTNGNRGWSAYVFDGVTDNFIGAPSLFEPSGSQVLYDSIASVGVDPTSGRVFAQDVAGSYNGRDKNGLVCKAPVQGGNNFAVLETQGYGNSARLMPSGDATLFGGGDNVVFDPVRRNLFFINQILDPQPCDATHAANRYSIAVYHDDRAPLATTGSPDLDSPTRGQGQGANWGAQASAFGARYAVEPSGVEGPLTNVDISSLTNLTCDPSTAYSHFFSNSNLAVPQAPAPPAQYHAFCHAGNRVATFARVADVGLDASEVRADAIAAETDNASAQDLANSTDLSGPGAGVDQSVGYVNTGGPQSTPAPTTAPVPCHSLASPSASAVNNNCYPHAASDLAPYVGGQALPFAPASCRDSGGSAVTNERATDYRVGQSPPVRTGGPSVALAACALEVPTAHGEAYTNAPSLGYPAFAHDAMSSATTTKASQDSAAEANTVVDGIQIGGYLHIGKLEMHAKVAAGGRGGTSRADFTCTVSQVTINIPSAVASAVTNSNPAPSATPVPSSVSLPAPLPAPVPSSTQLTPPAGDTFTVQIPGTTSCWDPSLAADISELNGRLEGQLRIEFPKAPSLDQLLKDKASEPYGRFVTVASPGGYIAQVGASKLRQLENTTLLSDSSIEQPGLVVTVYADSVDERDRLVATFGGVAATATYGVFPLADCSPYCDNVPSSPGSQLADSPPVTTINNITNNGGGGGGGSAPPAGGTAPLAEVQKIMATIVDGMRFIWQHPELIPPLLAVWALLAWPWFVMARRRALNITTGGEL